MPFVIPRVVVQRDSASYTDAVHPQSAPTADALCRYMDWLESELALAKSAYEEATGTTYEPNTKAPAKSPKPKT